MSLIFRRRALVLSMAAGALMSGAAASGETVDCRRIVSVPATISRPGIYCLTRNVSTATATGSAIAIESDDVVLDLNGFSLDGVAGPATEAYGILAFNRRNVAVHNGTVRGFFIGVVLAEGPDAEGNVVEGIHAEANTAGGIAAGGHGVEVRKCRVVQTGGSTSPLAGESATGIALTGTGGRVTDNNVVDVLAKRAWGIHATRSDTAVIEGNHVSNSAPMTGLSFGIIVPFSQSVLVVDNRIQNVAFGVTYSSGATGKYRDNLTHSVPAPFSGTGTDAGNNN
jgi:hypothetical protein